MRGFLADDFRLDYVYHYSSTSQALPYKIGALWGGQAGSLLLWVLILAVMAAVDGADEPPQEPRADAVGHRGRRR